MLTSKFSNISNYTQRLEVPRQSINDVYARPDNLLEIEVCNPITHSKANEFLYTEYEIRTKTNIPIFCQREFIVRRRYSDFEWLHKELSNRVRVLLPELPGKSIFSRLTYSNGIFDPIFIEKRREQLEIYLNKTISHPLVQSEQCVHSFLRDKVLDRQNYVPGKISRSRSSKA